MIALFERIAAARVRRWSRRDIVRGGRCLGRRRDAVVRVGVPATDGAGGPVLSVRRAHRRGSALVALRGAVETVTAMVQSRFQLVATAVATNRCAALDDLDEHRARRRGVVPEDRLRAESISSAAVIDVTSQPCVAQPVRDIGAVLDEPEVSDVEGVILGARRAVPSFHLA